MAHVKKQSSACGCAKLFFLLVLPFPPHLLNDPSHMSWDNLKRAVKLNKNELEILWMTNKKNKESPDLHVVHVFILVKCI